MKISIRNNVSPKSSVNFIRADDVVEHDGACLCRLLGHCGGNWQRSYGPFPAQALQIKRQLSQAGLKLINEYINGLFGLLNFLWRRKMFRHKVISFLLTHLQTLLKILSQILVVFSLNHLLHILNLIILFRQQFFELIIILFENSCSKRVQLAFGKLCD